MKRIKVPYVARIYGEVGIEVYDDEGSLIARSIAERILNDTSQLLALIPVADEIEIETFPVEDEGES